MSKFRNALYGFSVKDVGVRAGIAKGDELAALDDLNFDDLYQIADGKAAVRLLGNIAVEGAVTFDDAEGQQHQALLVISLERPDRYLCPITDMTPNKDYRLIHADPNGHDLLQQLWLGGFLQDTMIALADGTERAVQDLGLDDQLLGQGGHVAHIVAKEMACHRACGLNAPAQLQPPLGQLGQSLTVHAQHIVSLDTCAFAGQSTLPAPNWVTYHQLVLDQPGAILANGHWVFVNGSDILALAEMTKLHLIDALGAKQEAVASA